MVLAKLTGMARIETMRLSRFDLNLLVVFEALMEERSVSRAASRLALSQPAASHALSRLRALVDDPLFIRTASGMEPTARAHQLALPIRRALEGFATALEPETFSAATDERDFRLALNNHAALVLATPILLACATQAPGIRLDIRPSGNLAVDDLLDRGELDFVIMARSLDRQRFASCILNEDDYRIVMRRDHQLADVQTPLTLRDFAGLSRVDISSSGEDMAFVGQALANAGLPNRTVGAVPYLALPALLRDTDHIAIVRQQIAQVLAYSGEIVIRPLPLPNRSVASVLSWHQRHSGQPAHVWLAELILQVSRRSSGTPA